MQLLSKKAILFLTGGFAQSFVFQNIFSIIEDHQELPETKILKIVLSDGEVYISGIYHFKKKDVKQIQKCSRIGQFDILRVNASYQGSYKPIHISSLQILSQNHPGLYGKIPISIQDYLVSRMAEKKVSNESIFQINQHMSQIQNIGPKDHEQQIEIDNKNVQNQQKIPQVLLSNSLQQLFKDTSQEYELIDNTEFQQNKQYKPVQQNMNQNLIQYQSLQIQKHKNPNKKINLNQYIEQNPQKFKQVEIQQLLTQTSPPFEKQFQIKKNNSSVKQKSYQQINKENIVNQENKNQDKPTQKNAQMKIIEIDVIDLDNMSTQKEQMICYAKSNRKQFRKSYIKSLEAIFQSQEKQQPPRIQVQEQATVPIRYNGRQNQHLIELDDQITRPRNQFFTQPTVTPIKNNSQNNSQLLPLIKSRMGSTTQRRKIKDEYNLLIQNLYEDNCSFKIICRVNYLYEWKSKNGKACMGLELMDMNGEQIKAVLYMNHLSKQCERCAKLIEVGKVYCFQNGECKRAEDQKNQLELIFNLRGRSFNADPSTNECTGKGKIILANKIIINPIAQNKVISITQAVQLYDSGRKHLYNVYGIIQWLKISEYQQKIQMNNQSSDQNSAQIGIPELKNQAQMKQSRNQKNNQGFKRIYLNGSIINPLQKCQITFNLLLRKPINQFDLDTQNFLQRNYIKTGSLIILHNMKINSTINDTVKRLQKTKRSYMQVISCKQNAKINMRNQFAAECVSLPGKDHPIHQILLQIFEINQKEIEEIMKNPRLINFSSQPYTIRKINQMNEISQKHLLVDQFCHSQLIDVKIHSIQEKPCIHICQFCKKKIMSQNTGSKTIKYCTKCKKIVKTTVLYIFNLVFADNTASFHVQILKQSVIESFLELQLIKFENLPQDQKHIHLQKIKYNQFRVKVKSQNKMGGPIHRIVSIQKMQINSKINEIRQQRKGVQKHYRRLETSW